MARLTLRVPQSLRDALAERASREGVSMNQYIVFALSRVTAADTTSAQRAEFEALRARYPEAAAEAALRQVLDEREVENDREGGETRL